jgi:hypothetical protein
MPELVMPSWCLTITDAEPPSAGFYRAMDKVAGEVRTHVMADRRDRPGGPCFFVYTGAASRDGGYPHVTVMLAGPLNQRAGLLFFRSSEFHVSYSADRKLFYVVNEKRLFDVQAGQGGVILLDELKGMGTSFINILRSDITQGISPDELEDGWENLRRPDRLRPWEWEALQKQNLMNDQARLRQVKQEQDEAWASQFEAPEGM